MESMNASSSLTRIPEPLEPGDRIMLAAPARFVTEEQANSAVKFITEAGFVAVVPEGLFLREGQFGGSDVIVPRS